MRIYIYRITKKEIHDRKPEYSEFFTEEDLYKFVSPRIKVNGENARTIKNKIQFAIQENGLQNPTSFQFQCQ